MPRPRRDREVPKNALRPSRDRDVRDRDYNPAKKLRTSWKLVLPTSSQPEFPTSFPVWVAALSKYRPINIKHSKTPI